MHKNIYNAFKEKFLLQVKSLRPNIDFGAIVNQLQMEKVLEQIQNSIQKGDLLLTGGQKDRG